MRHTVVPNSLAAVCGPSVEAKKKAADVGQTWAFPLSICWPRNDTKPLAEQHLLRAANAVWMIVQGPLAQYK